MAKPTTAKDSTDTRPQDRHIQMSPVLKLLGKTTSTFMAGTFFVVLAWKRDALMVSFFVGAISNWILSKILKKIIKQKRPMEAYSGNGEAKLNSLEPPPHIDNGMPSSHAMSLGFIGTFLGLLLMNSYPYLPILLAVYAFISLWYRIESKLHTWEQVTVGVTLGCINGVLWRCVCFGTTQPFVHPAAITQDLPIHFMDFVTNRWLNEQGLFPISGLAIPLAAAVMIVGSVERRLDRFLKMKKEEKEQAVSTLEKC